MSDNIHAGQDPSPDQRNRSFFWPIMLIGIGGLLLLSNLGVLPWTAWILLWRFWPLVLIAIGIEVLIGQRSTAGAVISALLILVLFAGAGAAAFFAPQMAFFDAYTNPGEWQSRSIVHPLQDYIAAEVFIDWTSLPGELSALDSSSNLIEADLTYRGELIFDVRERGERAEISLDTRTDGLWFFRSLPQPRSSWKLYLTPEIPLDLTLDSGSGSCGFDLSELQLEALLLDSGSGAVDLSLPGSQSFPVTIDSGSGRLRIDLPADSGVQVRLDSGSGSFHPSSRFQLVSGERREDGIWETENFNSAENRITITLDQGSGSVTIR